MHDPWIEKLSDHIDGRLNDADARGLQEHLAHCAECRSIADGLRDVVAAAHNAPVLEPERDLWTGIAAGIAALTAAPAPGAPVTSAMDGMRASAAAARRAQRRFSFSMPQLAAAAILLMALSGAGAWMIAGRPDAAAGSSGTIIQSAGSTGGSVSTVAAGLPAEYVQDVTGLERALEENRAELDPATVEIIQRSLESIDRAISDARTALAADPGNPHLHRQLDNTMRKKIDVLRRATGVQRAQS